VKTKLQLINIIIIIIICSLPSYASGCLSAYAFSVTSICKIRPSVYKEGRHVPYFCHTVRVLQQFFFLFSCLQSLQYPYTPAVTTTHIFNRISSLPLLASVRHMLCNTSRSSKPVWKFYREIIRNNTVFCIV
jgi:hypothetical protein